ADPGTAHRRPQVRSGAAPIRTTGAETARAGPGHRRSSCLRGRSPPAQRQAPPVARPSAAHGRPGPVHHPHPARGRRTGLRATRRPLTDTAGGPTPAGVVRRTPSGPCAATGATGRLARMKFTPRWRKAVLTLHVASAVGWLGVDLVLLTLG